MPNPTAHESRKRTHSGSTCKRSAAKAGGGRLSVAVPLVPAPLWFVLGVGAAITIAYMCVQADRREGLLVQSIPIGFVTTMVAAGMLVILFLDRPFANESGRIAPTEMRHTLSRIDHGGATPCDERGTVRPT